MFLNKISQPVWLKNIFLLWVVVLLSIPCNLLASEGNPQGLPFLSLLLGKSKYVEIKGWGIKSSPAPPINDDAAFERIVVHNQIAAALKLATLQAVSSDGTLQTVVDSLKLESNISAIESKENTLYIYDKTGGVLVIPLVKRSNKNTKSTLLKVFSSSFESSGNETLSNDFQSNVSEIQSKDFKNATPKVVFNIPLGKKALIFSGFQHEFHDDYILCSVKNSLENAGFLVDVIVNQPLNLAGCNVPATPFDSDTLDYIINIHDYGVVYMSTHGTSDSILTGIPIDKSSPKALAFIQRDGVQSGGFFDQPRTEFAISSEYFKKDINVFDNTIVQIDACLTGLHYNFANALTQSGAMLFIAWDDAIYNHTAASFSIPFWERLSQGHTVSSAIFSSPAIPTSDSFSYTEELTGTLIRPTPNLKLSYINLDTNMSNVGLVRKEGCTIDEIAGGWDFLSKDWAGIPPGYLKMHEYTINSNFNGLAVATTKSDGNDGWPACHDYDNSIFALCQKTQSLNITLEPGTTEMVIQRNVQFYTTNGVTPLISERQYNETWSLDDPSCDHATMLKEDSLVREKQQGSDVWSDWSQSFLYADKIYLEKHQ